MADVKRRVGELLLDNGEGVMAFHQDRMALRHRCNGILLWWNGIRGSEKQRKGFTIS